VWQRNPWRLDASLIGLVIALTVVSLIVWLGPTFPGVADARALDTTINVSAVLIGAGVAVLAWVRWRDTGEPVALYVGSAFVALTTINAFMIGILFAGREAEFGLSPARPGEAPVYLWTMTRLAAAGLLVIGAIRSLRRQRPPLPEPVIVLAPTVILLVTGVVLFGREAVLPPVPSPTSFEPLGATRGLLIAWSLGGGVQIAILAAVIVAAFLLRRLYLRERRVSDAYLTVGLVIAAFSQLHFLLAPVVAIGVVTSTDALRLVFYGVLLLGIQAELSADLRALRRANLELERLREVDAASAALAERTRLAREIHDGLAQDLWYAKLKQSRLVQAPGLENADRTTAGEVLSAIESALAEARQAVMAMRPESAGGSSLGDALRAAVEDFSDRSGVRAEFEGEAPSNLAPRAEAEILRVVQEALNNVHRHADATMVRVRAERAGEIARVQVVDNGRGFDPSSVSSERYGLPGMRERAELVGGRLVIRSQPFDGTSVTLEVPVQSRATSP
jgi:signal transduction histidine kinase